MRAALFARRIPCLACLVSFWLAGVGAAQQRLLDRPPFDRVHLDEANEHFVMDVLPLGFHQGAPDPLPKKGNLEVRMLERAEQRFRVRWSNIEKIETYEDLLLEEAQRLTRTGQFDEAFHYFERLRQVEPPRADLAPAIDEYLYRHASAAYQNARYDDALSIITALYERSPQHEGLSVAITRIAEAWVKTILESKDYAQLRGALETLETSFPKMSLAVVGQWNGRLDTLADEALQAARAHLDEQRYDEARESVRQALNIRPTLPAAAELGQQIHAADPRVVVGVYQLAPAVLTQRLDDWTSRRVRRLTDTQLAELSGYSETGGQYGSPLGEMTLDSRGLYLDLRISPQAYRQTGWTAPAVVRRLHQLSDADGEDGRGGFAALVEEITVDTALSLRIAWRRSHVRPEALLAVPMFDPLRQATGQANQPLASIGPFQPAARTPTYAWYEPRASLGASWELREQLMTSEEAALKALRSGAIDVLERVSPWSAARLADEAGIRVGTYALPSVHVLVCRPDHPLLDSFEMRRAIRYAIDSASILEQVISGGESATGFAVLSGPFPVGRSLGDSIGYGYDRGVTPREYQPVLATMLHGAAAEQWAKATGQKTADGKGQKVLPKVQLTLAHPPQPVARVACRSIRVYLQAAQIEVTLREATADEIASGEVPYDLWYAELGMSEPMVDARRLLGPRGMTGQCSPYMALALRQLDLARNWQEVRQRIYQVHRVTHDELSVIPLWQTINYYAHRDSVSGIGEPLLSLYENVSGWAPGGELASVAQSSP